MKRKTSVIRGCIGIILTVVIVGMLLIGIEKNIVWFETAMLIGAGILLIVLKEPSWIIYLQIIYCFINKLLISQFGA